MYKYAKNKTIAATLLGIFVLGGVVLTPVSLQLTAPIPRIQKAEATGFPVADFLASAGIGVDAGTNTTTTAKTVLQWIAKLLGMILKAIAKVLLNKLTEATVNWINGGFKGSPQFVQNPESFFKNIGNAQLENLIDTIGYNASKFPYGREISQALIWSYRNQNGDIAQKMRYTLGDILGQEANKFQNNFNVGGWAGYEAFNSNPANNVYGALFVGANKAANTVAKGQQLVQQQLNYGQGFLNQRTCVAYRSSPQVGPQEQSQQGAGYSPPLPTKQQQGQANAKTFFLGGAKSEADCITWKTVSPGSVVQSQINRALGSKFSQTELGAALGNSISAIVNALTTKLLDKGLSALSTAISKTKGPGPVWTYDGQSLAATSNSQSSNDPSNWTTAADINLNLKELFYTGQDIGITDASGNQIKLTLIEQAQAQVDAYKRVLDLMRGISQQNPDGTTVRQESFASMVRTLDYALPGPKYGWKQRIVERLQTAVNVWSQRAVSRSIKKYKKEAEAIAEDLQNFSGAIPNDIEIQLLTSNLPSYNDAASMVQNGVAYSVKQGEFVDNYTTSLATLARLKSVKSRLDDVLKNHTADVTYNPEPDNSLDEFLADHPNETVSPAHMLNYPTKWQTILADPSNAHFNPFDYVTETGNQIMKGALKAYALLMDDLPNAATISQAQATYEQVKAQYDNIGLMINTILDEREIYRSQNIYHVVFGGYNNKFIQQMGNSPTIVEKVNPATLPANIIDAINQHGFIITSYTADKTNIARQVVLALFGIPTITNPRTPKEMYISPYGTGTIDDLQYTSSGFNQVQLPSNLSRADMVTTLAADPWFSGNLSEDDRSIYGALSDQQMTILYAIVTATTPISDLGEGWDTNSTGTERLRQALNIVDSFEDSSDTVVNADQTSERLFYCQAILDKYDVQTLPQRSHWDSLFRRPKIDLNCKNFYDSSVKDYTMGAF